MTRPLLIDHRHRRPKIFGTERRMPFPDRDIPADLTIPLASGGSFRPMDFTPFLERTHRVKLKDLPDLPAGVELNDLNQTLTHLSPENDPGHVREVLEREIAIRTLGYLPAYDYATGRDQFGYDLDGFDSEGRNRQGYTREELAEDTDPLLSSDPSITLDPGVKFNRDGTPRKADPVMGNYGRGRGRRGRPKGGGGEGQKILATDNSDRTLARCWFDLFALNEQKPPSQKMDDNALLARMHELFPDRVTANAFDIGKMRWRYNEGRLGCQKRRPRRQSFKYVRDLNGRTLYKCGPRGFVIQKYDMDEQWAGEFLGEDETPKPIDAAPTPEPHVTEPVPDEVVDVARQIEQAMLAEGTATPDEPPPEPEAPSVPPRILDNPDEP